MNIQIKLFAAARQAVDSDVVVVELPPDANIGTLRAAVAEQQPQLKEITRHSLFAVGTDYRGDDHALSEGDDVSLIPPVSGG